MLIRRIARPMLSATFIARGVEALRSPKPAADAARPTVATLSRLPDPVGANVPTDPELVARATAAVQIAGGLLLATGRLPRLASAALALSVVPGSLGGHTFWQESDPQRKAEERRAFLTDLSLIGGLIIAAADTEGRPSLGWRGRRAARKVSGRVAETVGTVLPVGAAAGGTLAEGPVAEKVGRGLRVGGEHAAELAGAAAEQGAKLAGAAAEQGAKLAGAAAEQGAKLVQIARERAPESAESARSRAQQLAELARDRGPDLAEAARRRGEELADVARERTPEIAAAVRQRAPELVDTARSRAHDLAESARHQADQRTAQARRGRRRHR
ncbi:MAG: DoxX family membrane protein [Mycolicibacterium hassiacum]